MRAEGWVIVAVALFALTSAAGSSSLALRFDVPKDTFFAITLTMEADSPAEAGFHLQHCGETAVHHRSRGVFTIDDGVLVEGAIRPGDATFHLDGRNVVVGIEGTHITSRLAEPDLEPFVYSWYACQSGHGTWSPTIRAGDTTRDVTFVGWSTTRPGVAFLNITSGAGVSVGEPWRGPVSRLTPQEFEHGVSAAVAPPDPYMAASGGALLSHSLEPEHDFVGYWWPWRGEAHGRWWCEMGDTGGCPGPWNEHYMLLSSKGPTTWNVGYDHYVQIQPSQHDVLVGIDLGRDDVLAQG